MFNIDYGTQIQHWQYKKNKQPV